MDFQEIKNKSVTELKALIMEWRAGIRDLRFKSASSRLKKVHQTAEWRRAIARALTVLKEKK